VKGSGSTEDFHVSNGTTERYVGHAIYKPSLWRVFDGSPRDTSEETENQ